MSGSIVIPQDLASVLTSAINAIIQSPAVQDAEFVIASGCQPSVLNNMYFCDAASVSGSETYFPHTDFVAFPHVDTPNHVDTNNHVDTPNHVDTKLVHDDAHWDVPGFIGIPHTDSHTDTMPHDDTSLHDDTSTAHDDTSLHDDTAALHSDIAAATLRYQAKLTQLTGAGSMVVGDLVIPPVTVPMPPPTEFSFGFTAGISFSAPLTPTFYLSVSSPPLPPLTDTSSVAVTGTVGTVAGVITLYCTGNPDNMPSGFYATITDMTVTLPTSVTSYSKWTGIVGGLAEWGLDTAWAVGAGDALLAKVTSLVNGFIASETEAALNGVLDTMQLAPCNC